MLWVSFSPRIKINRLKMKKEKFPYSLNFSSVRPKTSRDLAMGLNFLPAFMASGCVVYCPVKTSCLCPCVFVLVV